MNEENAYPATYPTTTFEVIADAYKKQREHRNAESVASFYRDIAKQNHKAALAKKVNEARLRRIKKERARRKRKVWS